MSLSAARGNWRLQHGLHIDHGVELSAGERQILAVVSRTSRKVRAGRLESAQSVGRSPQMIKLSLTRLAVAVGGLGLWLTAGVGVASADPDLGPIVNTTCSYPQVMSALNAQDPAAAAQFNSSPPSQSFLRQFLAAPRNQRMQMAQQIQSAPGAQENFGLIQQVFNTCNNF
jgi:hemophore-related protein